MARFTCDLTYNELFSQTVAFINRNNDGKPRLRYPKLYLIDKNPKCNYKQGCKQCYGKKNTIASNNDTSVKLILCVTKRRQLSDKLCDSGQEQKCMTNSLTTTISKLYLNDKTLIQQSKEYKLQSNWFVKVYSFLRWQQEATKTALYNLAYRSGESTAKDKFELKSDDIDDAKKDVESVTTRGRGNVFSQRFDTLWLLHSYLGELIEYLVIYFCCFDSRLWIPVFYPFIETAIGTSGCAMLFAECKTRSKLVVSVCQTTLEQMIGCKEQILQEMRGVSTFKLLLCDACEANNSNITDVFDLTHKIHSKLEENTNNIKTQHLIQQLAHTDINDNNDSKIQEDIILNESSIEKDDWIMDDFQSSDTIRSTRIEVPSFIRLFIIKRIVDHGIFMNMAELGRLLQSSFKNKTKTVSEARKILEQLVQDGIKKYMAKWYEESQIPIIERVFNKLIMQRFMKEYHDVATYVGGCNTTEKKTKMQHQILVFNINDLMCNIFQHLHYGRYFNGDLFSCSLVCSVWLYHVWNLNSLYCVDISELIKGKLHARTWQRLHNAKFIRCDPIIYINNNDNNDDNDRAKMMVKELSMFSMITNSFLFKCTISDTFKNNYVQK